MIQLQALAVAAVAILAAAALLRLRGASGRAVALRARSGAAPEPYILYFTGDHCSICKTHQEPALRRLGGVRVQRVDALAEPELTARYAIRTLPSTVVVAPSGATAHVNYGYAPADKLRRQLETIEP